MMGNVLGGIFGGLFLLAWSGGVLVMDYKFVGMLGRDRAASGRPTVSAIITRSEVESKSGDERNSQSKVTYSHPFKVSYSYEVNGREYAGDKFHHGMHAGGLKSARVIQARYAVGSRVSVHYNPADPADSVMTTGLRGADLLALMFMTPFNVVMLVGWWWVAAMIAGSPSDTVPVTRLSSDGGEVRLRLEHLPPVGVFSWALLGTSFGMVVVVMTAFGGGADVTQMTFAWAVVLALAAGLPVWQARRIAAGWYDFRVDRLRGTLALPHKFKNKAVNYWASTARTGEVALTKIVDIRVASREARDSEGDRTVYHELVVIHVDDVAAEAVLEVRTRTTEEHAREIVRQLRREVGLEALPQ